MNLQLRVKLFLPKESNTIKLQYSTYQKATYDQYLIASLIHRSESKEEAYKYIDELTGEGSLNQHFKNLYVKMKSMTADDLENVLKNSLYPKLVIDNNNYYMYYPDLNTSVYLKRNYPGNLGEDEQFVRHLVPEIAEYQGHEIVPSSKKNRADTYNIDITDTSILIHLGYGKHDVYPISEDVFSRYLVRDALALDDFKGSIHKNVTEGDWNILSSSKLNNMLNATHQYYHLGDHMIINNDYLLRTRISLYKGIHLYTEERIDYTRKNDTYCQEVLDALAKQNSLLTFKLQSIIKLLRALDYQSAQRFLTYILDRQDRKELGKFGLDLVMKGIETNWSSQSLRCIWTQANTANEKSRVYRIDSGITDNKTDLMIIHKANKTTLTEEHRRIVEEHQHDRTSKITEINRIIGTITASGRRESTKKLVNDKEVAEYRKLANQLIGHVKTDITNLSDHELMETYNKVIRFQSLDDRMIQKLEQANLI